LFTQAATGKPKVRWSHEIFPSPRNVRFNEMEYAIPAAKAAECLSALVALCRKEHVDTAFPFEVRWVKCDDLWLSPFSGRDCVTLSVHQYFRQSHDRFFALCEGVFRQYEGRPHWGKLHTLGERELAELYPQFGAFRTLRRRLDPNGRFLTPYWAHVMGEPTP
jgi:FAD/FMN-containing dehydrogenase